MKGVLVVRADRCTGCKSCEIACSVEHSRSKTLVGAIAEVPPPCSRVTVVRRAGISVPHQCRQCMNAKCMAACPTGALHRADNDSPVLVDDELCTRCGKCVPACPFKAIRLDERSNRIMKCDQCPDRTGRGELPACVEACPVQALAFRPISEVGADKKRSFLVINERGLTK